MRIRVASILAATALLAISAAAQDIAVRGETVYPVSSRWAPPARSRSRRA